MIASKTLESLIEERVSFRPISTGWIVGKCALCNDYKERAGFKFDGGIVGYNCWNCSTSSQYEEFSCKISSKFRRILNAYGIDDSEISSVVNSAFFNDKKVEESENISLSSLKKISTHTPTISLPPKALKLGLSDDFTGYQEKLLSYLVDRKVDVFKYPFYFSLDARFKDRVIIPFYRNGNLIYWQARSIHNDEKMRYDNSPVNRDSVIFNMDALNRYSPLPLFVTEGVFDAMMFDGIGILGGKLNESKTEILKKSNRRLVFVIDKDKIGAKLAADVLQLGWEISFAPDGVEDLNRSVQRFGRSWTAYQVMRNIPKDMDAARLAIEINCRN
jgi:hypothetical protein